MTPLPRLTRISIRVTRQCLSRHSIRVRAGHCRRRKSWSRGLTTNFTQPDAYPTDARGLAYSYAFFSAKHLGEGQFYLMTIKDKEGNGFDGARTYRLHVPPNVPVKLYWSATAYDRATHALIRDLKWSSRSSNTPGLQKNPDASVDLYFAPKAPAGKESNWVPTNAGGSFEVLFRLYGPEKAFFEKTWILPDIEKMEINDASFKDAHQEEKMATQTKPTTGESVPVTVDNFVRAETDRTFGGLVTQGAFGKFEHFRELAPIDKQVVPRANRDTLYSAAVFDLDAAPVTITLPEAGKRFMTMIVIDEDHYVLTVIYAAGSYTFTRDKVGTRYVLMAIRTLVDPANPKDVEQVHALQDAVKVSQNSSGRFEVPHWNEASQKKVRDALKALGENLPDLKECVWNQSAGRSGEALDRDGHGLGRQSRQGRNLSQRHTRQK